MWRDPEPVPDEAHQGRQWGWELYRDDGAGWGTWKIHMVAGGTGPCWNIGTDDVDELLHVCDLDKFIDGLIRFRDSDVRRQADKRWD